ncbi:MAG: CBS domain-containing protein [Nitrososphaera sp.]|jgi:predicted transcriptional regulator
MNSSQFTYDRLSDIRNKKISAMIKDTPIVEPYFSISKTVGQMLKLDVYDIYSKSGRVVLTTNARELLGARDIINMRVSSFLHSMRHLTKSSTLGDAATIMSHYRTRSAPVMEDGEIIGAVYAKDIISLLNKQNLNGITASSIQTPEPITINSGESLASAKRTMMTKRIDHLPVIRSNKITHVLTSMHLLSTFKPSERIGSDLRGLNISKRLESPIGNLGSTRVPNCATNSPVSLVIESMLKSDTTCCLLTLWDEVHGIITYKDLVNLLENKIKSDVPLYIVGLPDDVAEAGIVKTKLDRIIHDLRKVYPEVEEAKASVKTIHNPKGNRPHYEVTIRVITPYRSYSYTELGWELSKVFNILGNKITRNLARRAKSRWKTSIRKINKREIF